MYYDYITSKPPLNEETLAHYGVKGMKWKRRKGDTISGGGYNHPEYRRPLGRKKKVTSGGKGVHKRGDGLTAKKPANNNHSLPPGFKNQLDTVSDRGIEMSKKFRKYLKKKLRTIKK